MSSFLCFICHSTVNKEINEDTREKYRDVVGIPLCPDTQLCFICCHVLNKLSLFKSICFKRSLEYPVLFREKGTLNLQKSNLEIHVLCPEDCSLYQINNKTYDFTYNNDFIDTNYNTDSGYVKLQNDNEFHEHLIQFETVDNKTIDYNLLEQNVKVDEENHPEIEQDSTVNPIDAVKEFNDVNDVFNDCDDINDLDNDSTATNNEIQTNINESNEEIVDTINSSNENLSNDNSKQNIVKKSKSMKKKCFKKVILSLEEQKAVLEANRREKKYIEAEFKCYNCAMGFLFKDTYQTHMMRHEESNGEYQCRTCTLRFATVTVLRHHTAGHAERYECTKCGASLKPRAKRLHVCVKRNVQSVACQFCGNLFKDANGLQQHLKRGHTSKSGGRLLSCVVCGESYSNQAALRTHMIKHIKRKFHCEQCPASYSSPYTLTQHKRTHEVTGQLHHCSTCGVGYATKKSLLAHKRNTMNHQQTLFECPICNRVCPNQRSLASHIQTVHSSTKDYTCTLCPARYTSRKSLVRHMGTHNKKPDIKMAICHLCGSTFKGTNKLNRHLRQVCEKTKLEEEISALYY
ncbi:PR domain zinc finger protein 5-like [Nymphalis io]|uniref:PR domain zinc finger protein 5-like n=1 Tax=Inachis io TaxID=171585 RepID=UPI002169A35F|nr:PR domain zinc finger protein 5-like [Nymphalis io]